MTSFSRSCVLAFSAGCQSELSYQQLCSTAIPSAHSVSGLSSVQILAFCTAQIEMRPEDVRLAFVMQQRLNA